MFLAFGLVPLIGVLLLSFTTWNGIGTIQPSGLTSWRNALSDPELPHALWVTFEIMAISWLVQTPISILIGTFLAAFKRYRGFLAVLYFIPLLLSSAAISITFKALIDPNFGIGSGLGVDWLKQNWLGEPKLAMGVLVFIVSWQYTPFHSLIYQGAVRQIPASLYEASKIDGAGGIRQFFSITLPQIKYTIITSSTLMVVGSLTFFDLIYVLTGGGPGTSTEPISIYAFNAMLQNLEFGYGAALSVVIFLVTFALAVLYIKGLGADIGGRR
jgi:raffinose/stachyose/melibiose transport system permease protein